MELLILEVDGARFGIPTADVLEVVRAASLVAPPSRFPNMLGMLNYRGQILGVLELTAVRAQTHRELTPLDHFIIVQCEGRAFVLRVDQALEIMTWSDGDLPASEPAADAEPLVVGLTPIAHPRWRVVYLLDTGDLWSQMHCEKGPQPTPEVEAV